MSATCPHCSEQVPSAQGICPRCKKDMAGKVEDDLIGRVVAENFEILSLLGIGAMGRVYRARQISLDKIVAIKVLHRHLAGDPKLAKRFHREARAASRLNHPNSLQIIDFGQSSDGTLYIVMEYLEGESLGDLMEREFPFSASRMVHILGQVCDALEEAHSAAIIHRDLKPENVLVKRRDAADVVKVCDFGIAKIQDPKADETDAQLTIAGLVCGTPEYMSPEQARGEPLDGRTDVYAVGVIGYQMLTGQLPYTAATALGVITRHLTDPLVVPREKAPELSIDPGLEAVIVRALAKERAGRQASAAQFKHELEQALGAISNPGRRQTPLTAPIVTPPARTIMSGEIQVPRRRSTGLWAGLVLVAVVLAVGGYLLLAARPVLPAFSRASTTSARRREAPSPLQVTEPTPAPEPTALPQVEPNPLPPVEPAPQPDPVAADPDVVPSPSPSKMLKRLRAAHGSVRDSSRPDAAAAPPAVDAGRAAYEEGRRLFQASQYPQAIVRYREAERLGVGGIALYKSLAQAYARVGNVAAMCEAYRRVLRANPGDVAAQGIVGAQCR